MKLSNVCDEDLRKVALLKTKKGIATSEAKRAQQILYSRNKKPIFSGGHIISSNLDTNPERNYRSFAEENDGLSVEEYLEREKQRLRDKNRKDV